VTEIITCEPPIEAAAPAKPRHLLVATPCYGGMTTSTFASTLVGLSESCHAAGVGFTVRLSVNESLIPRARNRLVHRFLMSDCTHLLFFDADQGIDGNDIIEMMDLDLDIVGAPVPMKAINWEAVREAAIRHEPNIELSGPQFAFNLVNDGATMEVVDGCIEVRTVGTGCMLVKREVIERMIEAHPETMYVSDSSGDIGQPMHALFDTQIDHSNPLAPRYLSEDYTFCYRWRAMGGKVHLYLKPKVTHQGSYVFRGDVGRMFDPPPAHEWDDIPSLAENNPQREFHLFRYKWAAEHIFGLIVANAACGSGYGTPILAAGVPDRTVVGFDRSDDALAINAEKGYGHAIKCDIEAQNFSGYDVLVSLETFEHLKDPVSWLKVLSPDVKELVLSVPIIPTKHNNEHHLADYTEGEILNVLKALGWKVVDKAKQAEFVPNAVLLVYAVRQ
jgi:2-polyprenyl-3-methyl-5-hydroxy-6-metoxy-1,4-benzoquinol methylase